VFVLAIPNRYLPILQEGREQDDAPATASSGVGSPQ
jgi:hypothetical protein